jgi:hypothetical protein
MTEDAPGPRPTWKRYAKPVLLVALSLAVGWIIIGLVGRVDWAAVAAALGKLDPWQAVPLLAGLLLRQYLNAIPLARFVPGLGTVDSMRNDLAANLAGTVAPPPGDVVLRVAMFNSWGVNPVQALSASTLNMIMFYSVRFIAPIVGVALIGFEQVDPGQVTAAVAMAALSVGLIVAMMLVMRGDRLAALIGYSAGRVVRRFRAEVDPDKWAGVVVEFRAGMSATLNRELPVGMVAMLAMVLADAAILGMSLRFVGVGASVLPFWVILGAFLIAYPLTTLPMFGLGVMDAAMVAAWVGVAGLAHEASIVAGIVIWRVVTLLGTLALGAAVTVHWRRQSR